METVSFIFWINPVSIIIIKNMLYRFYRLWENLIILDASVAAFAMNAWMGFHSLSTSIIKSTV